MRWLAALVVCVGFLHAQSDSAPEIARAKANIEKLRMLVDAGAAPRVQLEKAEAALADAEDAAILRQTVYSADLTEAQTDSMLAAAQRRVDRREKAIAGIQKLIDAGVTSVQSLTPAEEDLDAARKEYTLAESRSQFIHQMAEEARAEEASANESPEEAPALDLTGRYDGDGRFSITEFARIESDFEKRFGKPMPVSAMGETAVHRSLGFDHRGRVDIALHPDQPEGHWLLEYLVQNHIPYFAFRHAVPGKATGAHIHIGPVSTRIHQGG
jgi:hypothetical protein